MTGTSATIRICRSVAATPLPVSENQMLAGNKMARPKTIHSQKFFTAWIFRSRYLSVGSSLRAS
jgi:hypothetical protein